VRKLRCLAGSGVPNATVVDVRTLSAVPACGDVGTVFNETEDVLTARWDACQISACSRTSNKVDDLLCHLKYIPARQCIPGGMVDVVLSSSSLLLTVAPSTSSKSSSSLPGASAAV